MLFTEDFSLVMLSHFFNLIQNPIIFFEINLLTLFGIVINKIVYFTFNYIEILNVYFDV